MCYEFCQSSATFKVSLGYFQCTKTFLHKRDYHQRHRDMLLQACIQVSTLIRCCNLQGIELDHMHDYDTFFATLTQDCTKDQSTYISWECTTDKYVVCENM